MMGAWWELLCVWIEQIIATPVNFIGNKVWTFSAGRDRRAAHRPS
jgi:putative flippase GtrA